MNVGFGRGIWDKPQGCSPEARLETLERHANELWDAMQDQRDCQDDIVDIVRDIQTQVKALIER